MWAGPGVETRQHKHSVLGRSLGIRGRACAERLTRNIASMSVTLDVSILSGLLNASASCAESTGSHVCQGSS